MFEKVDFLVTLKEAAEKKIRLNIARGKVYVFSTPEGAEVYFNGELKGETPLSLNYVRTGSYDVEIKEDFYKKVKRKIEVKKNKSRILNAHLEKGKSDLNIAVNPDDALIYINNKKYDPPLKLSELTSGKYHVKIEKKGYHSLEQSFTLNPGEEISRSYNLKKIKPGYLYIKKLPKDSEVNIKGSDKKFKQGVALMPGKYLVEIRTQYGDGDVLSAEIDENTDTTLVADLSGGGRLIINTKVKDPKFFLINEKRKFLNGSFLKNGKYKVGVFKKGYEDYFFNFEIASGEDVEKTVSLKEKGRLFVETGDEEADIDIKGTWDKFSQGMYLPEGEYALEISSEKFPVTIKKVSIEQGKDTRLNITPGEYTDPVTGMKFVYVKGGCFSMGCVSESGCKRDELPVHNVCIDGFWMGAFEVTQGQWKKIMDNNPSGFKNGDDFPVEKVSWQDAVDFTKKLNELSSGEYSYRLPTEAEWEYAARSRGISEEYSGGTKLEKLAWYKVNTDSTMKAGLKDPNYIGIYDMSGNVWEWCLDSYKDDAYRLHSKKNPLVLNRNSYKVFRGGSWYSEKSGLRVSNRGHIYSGNQDTGIGFRVVRVKDLHMDKF
ncbi:MAG: SUMF1/EgtB/PvdO family nonheme iron enzyme [Thermodesulfobacteriota bacterium]